MIPDLNEIDTNEIIHHHSYRRKSELMSLEK